jgi:hypothetical protein
MHMHEHPPNSKDEPQRQYPVFVMCGSDPKRRKLLQVLDPEGKYKSKALLPFLGKRVIDWQLEELNKCSYVEGLYLIGLSEAEARFEYDVHYVPSETTADFPLKLRQGLVYLHALGKKPPLVVISTSDAPAMKLQSINAFFQQLDALDGFDFVPSLVPEDITEQVFPHSGRVVARFRDHKVFPGELYALSPRAIHIGEAVIQEIHQRRRAIDRQRRKVSLGPILRFIAKRPRSWLFLLKFTLKQASLSDAERAFSQTFNCKAKGIIIPDPGFGMDMDLPEDYQRLQAYLQKHLASV